MTRTQLARARRRHHRRRWVLSSIETRRLMLAAMADIDCPGWRALFPDATTQDPRPRSLLILGEPA